LLSANFPRKLIDHDLHPFGYVKDIFNKSF
jgi:hypothetical protein